MFASFGQQFLNIIAPLPEGEEEDPHSAGPIGADPRGQSPDSSAQTVSQTEPRGDEEVLDEVPLDDDSGIPKLATAMPSAIRMFREASQLLSSSISALNDELMDREQEPTAGLLRESEEDSLMAGRLRESEEDLLMAGPLKESEDVENIEGGSISLSTPSIVCSNPQSEREMIAMEVHCQVLDDLHSCEQRLQNAEYCAWQARAEASELLFALESEKRRSEEAHLQIKAAEQSCSKLQAELLCHREDHLQITPIAFEKLLELSGLSAITDLERTIDSIASRFRGILNEHNRSLKLVEEKQRECSELHHLLSDARQERDSVESSKISLHEDLNNLRAIMAERGVLTSSIQEVSSNRPDTSVGIQNQGIKDEFCPDDAKLNTEMLLSEIQRLEVLNSNLSERLEGSLRENELLIRRFEEKVLDFDNLTRGQASLESELSLKNEALQSITQKNAQLQADLKEQASLVSQFRAQLNKYIYFFRKKVLRHSIEKSMKSGSYTRLLGS